MSTSTTRTTDNTSLSDVLRSAVLRGEYAPGQRLVESELCVTLGAGRAGVREALRLLAGDGLIELEPHRGARVRQISLGQAIEMAEVRIAVEGLLARRAAQNITPELASELRDIVRRTRDAIEAFDPLGYSELNERLHRRISEIAAHEAAATVVNRLRLQLVTFQVRLSMQPGRALATLIEHEHLADAIVSGDPDAAEASMRHHLEDAVTALRLLAQPSHPTPGA